MVPSPLIVLCGTTCTGKTTTAIELAERIAGEIIAADSRTVYRFLDIGTAKPTPAQQARVPHHLLDVASPDEVFTVARFRTLARHAIDEIRARGKVPILAGGTGLYIRAVTDDLHLPAVPPQWDLRSRLEEAERAEPGLLHRRLAAVDPVVAERIHPRNTRRLIRALEVFETTGRPISTVQRQGPPSANVARYGLQVDRAALYRRIESRVDQQVADGLVDEVRRLIDAGYPRTLPAMQGLGYKEIAAALDGTSSMEEAVRILIRNTRRYAKRQLTWFRADPRIHWIDATDRTPQDVADTIAAMLQ